MSEFSMLDEIEKYLLEIFENKAKSINTKFKIKMPKIKLIIIEMVTCKSTGNKIMTIGYINILI